MSSSGGGKADTGDLKSPSERSAGSNPALSTMLEEGDPCPIHDCHGRLKYVPDGDCTCFINPPCSACMDSYLACDTCDFSVRNEDR